MHLNGHVSLHGLGEMVGGELMRGINCTAEEIHRNLGGGDRGREGGA